MFKKFLSKLVIKIYVVEDWWEFDPSNVRGIFLQEKYAKAYALQLIAEEFIRNPTMVTEFQADCWGIRVVDYQLRLFS